MIRYTFKLAVHLAAVLVLIGTACWFAVEGKWEPATAFIGAVIAYFGSLMSVLRDQFVFGTAHHSFKIAADKGFEASSASVSSALLNLTEAAPKYSNDIERVLSGTFGLLFRRLKLLNINESGLLHPVSERADLFLRVLSHSAKANVSFCGDWKAEGTQNDSARQLGDILERIEAYRIRSSGGLVKASSLRKVQSSLVILKAMRLSLPVFLLRWSDAWGGYYWFVGGIQKKTDQTEEMCAQRELKEELCLDEMATQQLSRIASVEDRRVSKRQHVLTDYTYNLFSIALDDSCSCVTPLMTAEFQIPKTVRGGYQVSQRCKWHTWDEIRASLHLNQDAGAIIQAIERFGTDRIQLSLKNPIA